MVPSEPDYRKYALVPILLSLVLILGIYIGTKLNFETADNSGFFSSVKFNKLNALINYIEQEYVDEISRSELENKAIASLLQDLDPHSQYISAEELAAYNEPLEGNFEGVGIEFNIQNDTIVVVNVINGGPSEKVGISAGDRIISVDGENVTGNITNQDVVKKLRGKKGTEVEVEIFRKSINKSFKVKITRGTIPIHSIDVAFMVNDEIGYIKLSRFAKTTYDEFTEQGLKLKLQGMKKMILDLRGNGGGFLDAAIKIADEFLPNKKLIVYTEGKARPRNSYYATKRGHFEDTELVILIDEGSASASEIVAGAVQDNDRGIIIGRRSFGKGLVQEQTSWPDGSAIRLTIARYYTPTGRSIQKPYSSVDNEEYFNESAIRFHKGELFAVDSIKLPDSLKYYTPQGKVVYGGGGIMPDIFIPIDTINNNAYYMNLVYAGVFNKFAFEMVDAEREKFKKYKDFTSFDKNFQITPELFDKFIAFAVKEGIEKDFTAINQSKKSIKVRLKAMIARQLFSDAGYYPVILSEDAAYNEAVKFLSK
ncbi:MAG: S41 family peptidase [Bacteroidia bacterium]